MSKLKEILKPHYHTLQRTIKFFRRIGLKNRGFTIISNNCTAGYVYQYFGLKYRTPTAGLFFEANDYVKLASNPKKYFIGAKLEFINPADSKNLKLYNDSNNWGNYPVAKLIDIEIYFMHYPDQKTAENMWYRRLQRINFENMLFLFTENESFSKSVILEYLKINGQNKVCLTNTDYSIENESLIIDKRAAVGGGNFSWTPQIVLSAINWKQVLNELKN
jgi:uncharacterized protein (DUF1919 family)